jgi:hypothetical protein
MAWWLQALLDGCNALAGFWAVRRSWWAPDDAAANCQTGTGPATAFESTVKGVLSVETEGLTEIEPPLTPPHG